MRTSPLILSLLLALAGCMDPGPTREALETLDAELFAAGLALDSVSTSTEGYMDYSSSTIRKMEVKDEKAKSLSQEQREELEALRSTGERKATEINEIVDSIQEVQGRWSKGLEKMAALLEDFEEGDFRFDDVDAEMGILRSIIEELQSNVPGWKKRLEVLMQELQNAARQHDQILNPS